MIRRDFLLGAAALPAVAALPAWGGETPEEWTEERWEQLYRLASHGHRFAVTLEHSDDRRIDASSGHYCRELGFVYA